MHFVFHFEWFRFGNFKNIYQGQYLNSLFSANFQRKAKTENRCFVGALAGLLKFLSVRLDISERFIRLERLQTSTHRHIHSWYANCRLQTVIKTHTRSIFDTHRSWECKTSLSISLNDCSAWWKWNLNNNVLVASVSCLIAQ